MADQSSKDIGFFFVTDLDDITTPVNGGSIAVLANISGGVLGVYKYEGSAWVLIAGSESGIYDVAATYLGSPVASEVILVHTFAQAVTFPSGAGSSKGKALTAATASTEFSVTKNGTEVATMTWAAAGTVPTFDFDSETTYSIGDYLTVVAPGTADDTLADLGYTIVGTRN